MANIVDDKGYNQIYQNSTAWQIRTQRRAQMIASQMRGQNLNILEIGCGSGELAFFMSNILGEVAQVTGIDICGAFIEKAKSQYQASNLDFKVLDFNQVNNFSGQQFDYIVGNGILHHFYYHLEEALQNIRNLLNSGGKMIFFEPNLLNPYCYLIFNTTQGMRRLAKLEPDEKAFTKKFISARLGKLGFKNINITYRDFLLPNTPTCLIKPLCFVGDIVEKIPIAKLLSQSLFISAEK
jgi:ubiquinone/menaquinone biosynthesis C-methylase UbiE